MCDYDADLCKGLVIIFAVLFTWVTLDFFIVQVPETQYNAMLEKQAQFAQYRQDRQDLFDVISSLRNVRHSGRVDSSIMMTGRLFEYEM